MISQCNWVVFTLAHQACSPWRSETLVLLQLQHCPAPRPVGTALGVSSQQAARNPGKGSESVCLYGSETVCKGVCVCVMRVCLGVSE